MNTQKSTIFIAIITLSFSLTKAFEVQKICNGDSAPFRVSCRSNTGVSIESVLVQFKSKQVISQECENLISYNITENTRSFQNMCNRASDRSMCILDQGYVLSLFQMFDVSADIYSIPIRLLITYDCLGKILKNLKRLS